MLAFKPLFTFFKLRCSIGKRDTEKALPEDNECCCGDTISKLDSI
jgi:hypothetical protein